MKNYLMSLALLCALGNVGCVKRISSQLPNRVTRQANSIPNIYYQEVSNNVAMIQAAPTRMPYFSDPQTSRVSVQQEATGSYSLFWDLISTAPTGVLTLFNHYLLDRQSGTVSAYQRNSGEWASLTANDPDKLFTMRAAYRRVTGVASDEDQEILAEFYYRHFEITDQTLDTLRQVLPDVYQQMGVKLEKLKNIEYLSAESFEKRLKENDVIGQDDFDRYRRVLLKYSRMGHEPTEFVSDADTHHLLYAMALRPGWIGVGRKRDIPKTAVYVGQFATTFVWVAPENMEDLTRLTLAILDIHTFKSERIGGSRVQPGILPR
jgi:hypothetical protein